MDAAYQRGGVIRHLLVDLDAFFLEHPLCGNLDGGMSKEHAWYCDRRGSAYATSVAPVSDAA